MNEIADIKNRLPHAVYQKVVAMEPAQQAAFVEEFKRKGKSTGVAYVYWVLSLPFGIHYLYFKKTLLFFLFLFTLGGLGVWWLIDAFRIVGIVREHNKSVALDVLHQIQVLNS